MAPPAVEPIPEDTEAVPATIRSGSVTDVPAAVSRQRNHSEVDVFAPADRYYGEQNQAHKQRRTFTFSTNYSSGPLRRGSMALPPTRRASHDESSVKPKKFLINVDSTLRELLKAEDSDGNFQITIEDTGPKTHALGTMTSDGHKTYQVRGTYMLSNLLQELKLAQDAGRRQIVLDEARINENPTNRLQRLIKDSFWVALTRRLDEGMIEKAGLDTKDWTKDPRPRIYIPRGAPAQFEYYSNVAQKNPAMRLEVLWLPEKITAEVVKDMNKKPGLLALAMETSTDKDGKQAFKGVPFVVPGGRFNELYGWDSYMESLGLITDGRVDLAKGMVENFIFCIKHYGKILNANRSYYLCRSQPPFLTDMTIRVYDRIQKDVGARDFLKRATLAAIKEYHSVWMTEPRFDPATGLSRYHPDGLGVPPETESTHFLHILEPYYKKLNMSFEDYVEGYNNGTIKEPKLDEYFRHDRAVRESGHDTSYRLEGVAADLATIDLNSLLYKYESDLSRLIRVHFDDALEIPEEYHWEGMKATDKIKTSSFFDKQARKRRKAVKQYLWNEEKGMYFDYNIKKKRQQKYESATVFWAMWAGMTTPGEADRLVKVALPKLEAEGGLLSGTEESRGVIGLDRPNRQWDYPYGWAPQQMLAWTGLQRYGYTDELERLAYKWLYMVTKAFFDYNGVVVEKYDVTRPIDPHRVDAEYGNQGLDFKGVAKEGFGWVNASYVYGMTLINTGMRRSLGAITPYETYKRMTEHGIEPVGGDIPFEGDSQVIDDTSIPADAATDAAADGVVNGAANEAADGTAKPLGGASVDAIADAVAEKTAADATAETIAEAVAKKLADTSPNA